MYNDIKVNRKLINFSHGLSDILFKITKNLLLKYKNVTHG